MFKYCMQSIHAVLSPLADFTDMLSGKESIRVSAIKPLLNFLRNIIINKVLVASATDATLVADIKERICNYLESKYLILRILLTLQAFLIQDSH